MAIGNLDYEAKNEMFNLAAGASTVISVIILDDSIYESPETFSLQVLDENGDVYTDYRDDYNASVLVTIEPDLRCRGWFAFKMFIFTVYP